MNVIITGIKGFVGSNLSHFLQQHGHAVTGVSRDAAPVVGEAMLSWETLLQQGALANAWVHLAGKAHDTRNTSAADEYFRINTDLTKNLFDRFLQSEAQTFIYFSSVKAVADTVPGVLTETWNGDPRTPYGQSKLKAEEYLLQQPLSSGKRLIICRPCMIHGPGNKGNLNLLYGFVKKGIPYPLAAFENRRSFLSIDNLCFIINSMLTDTGVPSGVYNLADDEAISTNEVVRIISGTLQVKPRLLAVPQGLLQGTARIGDMIGLPLNTERLKKLTENYVVSNEKVKKALKIDKLPVSTKDGLVKTIRSFAGEAV